MPALTPVTAESLRIGAHVGHQDPVAAAVERGAAHSQHFIGDPQGWKKPQLVYEGGAAALREAAADAGVDLFVHAPYVLNVATLNNRIRIPSRKLLQQHVDVAAEIGAKGLIVHGGHVSSDDELDTGFDNWRKAVHQTDLKVPILIENTAGGTHAMARWIERMARLWDAIGAADGVEQVGFCLDTCHAHAGGNDLSTVVERVRAVTGRIDLVHLNDSRDAFDSGADRHTSLGQGHIEPDLLAHVVREAGAPVVCETPGDAEEHRADFAFIRSRL